LIHRSFGGDVFRQILAVIREAGLIVKKQTPEMEITVAKRAASASASAGH